MIRMELEIIGTERKIPHDLTHMKCKTVNLVQVDGTMGAPEASETRNEGREGKVDQRVLTYSQE